MNKNEITKSKKKNPAPSVGGRKNQHRKKYNTRIFMTM
jgi:hypothetical protein